MTPKFEARVYSVSTGDRIAHMSKMRHEQNNLANGQLGGAGSVTVPQFQISGMPAGPDNANTHIKGMAAGQMRSNSIGTYNNCVGLPKGGTCGGSRRRRRSRRSRKYKVKH